MTFATTGLFLASENGLPPEHIAAKLALPLGLLFFCGSVYLLLWAVYGAKKGALIYGVAFFGFNMMLGVFWWFGAPGTPVATGLRNFPGQPQDQYQGKWFAFEQGSARADFFPSSNSLDNFESVPSYLGADQDATGPKISFLSGDLDQATSHMIDLYLPTDESGTARLGAERRAAIEDVIAQNQSDVEAALRQGGAQEGTITRAQPFFTARVAPTEDGEGLQRGLTDDDGTRVAGAKLQLVANFAGTNADGAPVKEELVVEEQTMFAFKDPGALWFPSAVWTAIAVVGLVGCGFGLDRMEQREKRRAERAAEESAQVRAGATV